MFCVCENAVDSSLTRGERNPNRIPRQVCGSQWTNQGHPCHDLYACESGPLFLFCTPLTVTISVAKAQFVLLRYDAGKGVSPSRNYGCALLPGGKIVLSSYMLIAQTADPKPVNVPHGAGPSPFHTHSLFLCFCCPSMRTSVGTGVGSGDITLLSFKKGYRNTISWAPNDLCLVCLGEPVPTVLDPVVLLKQPHHAVRHLGHLVGWQVSKRLGSRRTNIQQQQRTAKFWPTQILGPPLKGTNCHGFGDQ